MFLASKNIDKLLEKMRKLGSEFLLGGFNKRLDLMKIFKNLVVLISLEYFNSPFEAQSNSQKFIIKEINKNDFNKDNISDEILIKENKCIGHNDNQDDLIMCRTVFVTIKGNGERDILSTSNSYVIPCSNCNEDGTDPFKNIKVHNGGFSIVLAYKLVPEGTKISKIITFKYDEISNNFLLSKKIQTIYSHKNGESKRKRTVETEKNFGKIFFSEFR